MNPLCHIYHVDCGLRICRRRSLKYKKINRVPHKNTYHWTLSGIGVSIDSDSDNCPSSDFYFLGGYVQCTCHQMQTISALLAKCAGISPLTDEFPAQKSVTRSYAVLFELRRNNGWINNRETDDLRCHRTQYDVTVMVLRIWITWQRRSCLS